MGDLIAHLVKSPTYPVLGGGGGWGILLIAALRKLMFRVNAMFHVATVCRNSVYYPYHVNAQDVALSS